MASATQELERFVHESLARGASKQEIEAALLAAGWDAGQLRGTLAAWAARCAGRSPRC